MTRVSLTNNTDLEFGIEIAQTGGETLRNSEQLTEPEKITKSYGWTVLWKDNYFPQFRSDELLYTIERGLASQIGTGKTYYFSTKLSRGDSYIGIHQKVKGTLLGSDMWNSLGGTDLSKNLPDTTETGRRQTIWHLPEGDICITYSRTATGVSYDNLRITLDYAPCK